MFDNLGPYLTILGPAFLAGLLVLSTHVPLGREVLRRGIIFLDLAIAQVAALGLVVAGQLGFEVHGGIDAVIAQSIAVIAAVTGGMVLYRLRRLNAVTQEALIGILFVLASTGSIILLAGSAHGGERLKALLVGQILWVKPTDLLPVAAIYALVLGVWFGWREKLGEWVFYPLFAVAITLSTQLVGVYLVFASLIVPALAAQGFRRPQAAAYFAGAVAYLLGLLLSVIFDTPSGATVVWCLALVGGALFIARTYRQVSREAPGR